MQKKPLVSIVTPSFNQAAFLEKTLLSVLEQDYPRIEYWVIDGGSTDNSIEIIKKYADRLAGWVSEKDQGQADAVNKGFMRANGDVIGWLNSDDLYYPDAIQNAVKAFQVHPEAAFVFSDVESVDRNGKPFHLMRYGDWKLPELMTFHIIGQPGVFMRRSVLEQAGHLDLSYQFLLDVQLWLKMAAIAPPMYVPNQVWAAARLHADAKNAAQAVNFGPEAFRLAKWLTEDPRFYPESAKLFKRIWAGAHRMSAYYLVEAGHYKAALSAYTQMFKYHPSLPKKTFGRLLLALAGSLGLSKLPGVLKRAKHELYSENKKHLLL